MVILCMLAGFWLCCTCVLLCKDIRSQEAVLFYCFYLFLMEKEMVAGSWIAVVHISISRAVTFIFVTMHTSTNIDLHICVASINLLLSLFGSCLESQCTLCGEPEGEWASPSPSSSCHRHLPACSSVWRGWEAERGRLGCKHIVLQSSSQRSNSAGHV